MKKAYRPLLIALIMVLAASACMVTLPVPVSAPVAPSPFATQTKGINPGLPTAVSTVTLPPPSPVPSITTTAFPSITPLPSATATGTETPIGFFPSATFEPPTAEITATTEVPDKQEGATDDWGSATRCTLMSKSPANWEVFTGKHQFKATWTLQNSGTKTWKADQMILTYLDGVQMSSQKKVILTRDVRVGQTSTVAITVVSPKIPGNYKTVWGLKLTNGHVFCTFTLKIVVK
ncbi:MAG: NBR1-Ig-like domain-containing protein [Chloroflexota bacterium]|jgi:hypothetical protein